MNILDDKIPNLVMIDVIHSWNEQLVTGNKTHINNYLWQPSGVPIPRGVRWIACQWEMCVIAKCDTNKMAATHCS